MWAAPRSAGAESGEIRYWWVCVRDIGRPFWPRWTKSSRAFRLRDRRPGVCDHVDHEGPGPRHAQGSMICQFLRPPVSTPLTLPRCDDIWRMENHRTQRYGPYIFLFFPAVLRTRMFEFEQFGWRRCGDACESFSSPSTGEKNQEFCTRWSFRATGNQAPA